MAAVEFDRQAIERRDFPIARRGYDAGAVDAHLRALAAEFDELQRAAITGGADISLASTAGNQVQSILAAAETAAAEIERHALEAARQVREAADRDAERTRGEAIEKARAHVAAVAQVAASLLERVGSMDGEVSGLIESLRAGASRLAADLQTVETNMSELYDAAAGRDLPEPERSGVFESELGAALAATPQSAAVPPPRPVAQPAQAEVAPPAPAGGADLDGARLIALNMALNGESRADTERYLAENFELPDRLALVDEVYAAVEG
jgi:DivIVA domain-containing protein